MPRSVLTPSAGAPSTIMLTRIIRLGMGPPSTLRGLESAVFTVCVTLQPAATTAAPATPDCFRNSLRLLFMALLLLGLADFAVILAQLALEHFADGAARQAFHDSHRGKPLHLADAAVGPLQQRLGVDRGLRHDESHRRLAPVHRRHADHGGLGDVRMGDEHALEVARVDVAASGNY